MAQQMYGTTGNRKMKRNQSTELNARLQLLPTIVAAEQDKRQLAVENKFRNKQLSQEKDIARKSSKFQKLQSKQALGMEVGKMGLNLAGSDLLQGSGTIGNVMSKFKGNNTVTPGVDPQQRITTDSSSGSGYFSGLSVGGGISGGLGGYGAASMFGGSKKKKMMIGAGAGLLTGLLGGGSGMGGALGGLFGGMIA